MTRIITLCAALALTAGSALADDNVTTKSRVGQLEDDIRYHEYVVEDSRDSIANLDERIAALKARLDSINQAAKEVKGQINALEKQKKAFQGDIKTATKARQETQAARDLLVYEQQMQPVLAKAYSKADVEDALKAAEGMETKDVLARVDLVKDYGRYTKEMRDFLEKQRATFAKLGWTAQGADSEPVKKFHKSLKGLSYYKVYEKGMKNVKNPSIPYLDKVIDEILVLERQGFSNAGRYDKVVDMLYGAK